MKERNSTQNQGNVPENLPQNSEIAADKTRKAEISANERTATESATENAERKNGGSCAAVQEISAEKQPDLRYKNGKEAAKGGLLGFFIGLAIIVPGVSGSTVAIIFRLYEKLLYALGNILKKFGKCVRFLLPIAVGVVIGFALGFFAVRYLLDVSPFTVIALFAGLMLGAYPAVLDEIRSEKKTAKNLGLFAVGFIIPVAVCLVSTLADTGERSLEGLSWYHYVLFLVLGYIVAITQVVPGLSATAVLMIAGYFQPIMDSVSLTYWQADPAVFAVYVCLGIGFLAGLISFSKGLTKIFERHKKTAFFCICGLSLASILTMFFNPEVYAVYQNWAGGASFALDLGLGIVLFLAGVVVSYLFVRYERKKKTD